MRRPKVPKRPPRQKQATDHRPSVAVFLGAGASKAFGYPLTSDLLPQLLDHLEKGTLTDWKYSARDQELLRRGIFELFPGIENCQSDDELPLITDVLTLIDHSMVAGTSLLGNWRGQDVTKFRSLVEAVIADMVDPSRAKSTPELKRLADWLVKTSRSCRLGLITTNYDIELELELFKRYGPDYVASTIDFGMSWREPAEEVSIIYPRPSSPAMSLYKLHGSLNWLHCPLCEYIYINVNGSIVHWAWVSKESPYNSCHCHHWPLQSVLVTPSYVRNTRDVNLMGIWRNSLDLLASADHWLLAGYSLPPEDIAIRALLIKAQRIREQMTQTGQKREKLNIWVIQGANPAERQRYKLLFPNAHYHDKGLEHFDYNQISPLSESLS